MPHERRMLDNISDEFTKYWVPINWVFNLCYEMRAKEKVLSDVLLNGMLLVIPLTPKKFKNPFRKSKIIEMLYKIYAIQIGILLVFIYFFT